MKKYLYLIAVMGLMVACQQGGETPELDTTELWPAGIDHKVPHGFNMETDDLFPDSALYGYINRQGKMVIPPRFVSAGTFSCGYAPISEKVARSESKGAYLDRNGKVHQIPSDLSRRPEPFYYNIATANYYLLGSTYPYTAFMIDRNMNILVKADREERIYPMTKDGIALSYKNNKITWYNRSGTKIYEPEGYCEDPYFKDGYIVMIRKENNVPIYHIVDTRGYIWYKDSLPLTNIGYRRFLRHHETSFSEEQYDVIDMNGKPVGSPDFAGLEPKEEMQIRVSHTHDDQVLRGMPTYYYINQDGKQTIPHSYWQASFFHEGYAHVGEDIASDPDEYVWAEKIINTKGETVLQFAEGQRLESIHNGLVLISEYVDGLNASRYTYMDLTGKVVYTWLVIYLQNSDNSPARGAKAKGDPSIRVYPEGQFVLGAPENE